MRLITTRLEVVLQVSSGTTGSAEEPSPFQVQVNRDDTAWPEPLLLHYFPCNGRGSLQLLVEKAQLRKSAVT